MFFLQGGSESWFTESNVAIASLAFHPTAQLLLIATNNELHFWDWSRPEPFAVVKTGSDTERVRWVLKQLVALFQNILFYFTNKPYIIYHVITTLLFCGRENQVFISNFPFPQLIQTHHFLHVYLLS